MYIEFTRKKVTQMFIIMMFLGTGLAFVPQISERYGQDFWMGTATQSKLVFSGFKYRFSFFSRSPREVLASIVPFGRNNQQKQNALAIPVLVYHGIGEGSLAGQISTEQFREQMFSLKEAGYTTVGIEDLHAFLKGEKQLPEKSFVITFDDGRKDSYYPIDPILRGLDFRAVMFIITRFSMTDKNNYYLTKDELHRMADSGRWDIQSHGKDDHVFYKIDPSGKEGHFISNLFWIDSLGRYETEGEYRGRIYSDLLHSKEDIEAEFGKTQLGFAFPFGDYGQATENFPQSRAIVLDTVRRVYPLAFYQVWAGSEHTLNYPSKDPFMVRRLEVQNDWTGPELLSRLEGAREKSLAYDNSFDSDGGWIRNWGDYAMQNGNLKIGATPDSTGSFIFLDGSYHWQDYYFTAQVNRAEGRGVSLLARFKDISNYTACTYTNGLIHIEQVVGGEHRVIKGSESPIAMPTSNFEIGIRVRGRTVECLLNGQTLEETVYLDPILAQGGVGFKTWDPTLGLSSLEIAEMHVKQL